MRHTPKWLVLSQTESHCYSNVYVYLWRYIKWPEMRDALRFCKKKIIWHTHNRRLSSSLGQCHVRLLRQHSAVKIPDSHHLLSRVIQQEILYCAKGLIPFVADVGRSVHKHMADSRWQIRVSVSGYSCVKKTAYTQHLGQCFHIR